jgi:flagellar basal body P-ring formation protein FlgA
MNIDPMYGSLLTQTGAAAAFMLLAGMTASSALADGGEIPVPRITLYPGDVIVNEMLIDRKIVTGSSKAGAVFESREAVLGKVARRTLLAGQPIPVNGIRDPYAVNQGAPVLIVFEADGLVITARGTALQSGGAGDQVSVRNVSSGTTIIGIVRADGSVRVGTQ